MTFELLLPLLVTSFFAGLLGSGHCFGMCGGIAGSLGMLSAADKRAATASALVFNSGRVLSYTLLGGLVALLFGGLGQGLELPAWGRVLRVLTAVLIGLIGLRFLFDWQVLSLLEKAGVPIWKKVAPWAAKAASLPGWIGRLLLGLCWGLLPCGLVYTMLFTAASTGVLYSGALVMLAFGMGTLPSMLGMSLAAPGLSAFLSERWTRRLVGVSLLLLAAWTLFLATAGTTHAGH